ncbi:hypothetical protein BpHYR1_009751 [Brachionus plicatilis]|uniref:Uncharacterized protein n=1 Tax=Brachionus plicatilis TaxID=10195 RepID=A0A3M7SBK4_BRAPC|nr:hypothetical protein BpHYR1_009751 [Brachionus plicatilis]
MSLSLSCSSLFSIFSLSMAAFSKGFSSNGTSTTLFFSNTLGPDFLDPFNSKTSLRRWPTRRSPMKIIFEAGGPRQKFEISKREAALKALEDLRNTDDSQSIASDDNDADFLNDHNFLDEFD